MIEKLNKTFCALPGVGSKTAQRFVYHLLERDREGGFELAKALVDAMEHVKHCSSCRTLSEKNICNICANDVRDSSQLCIVETPTDIHAIEKVVFTKVSILSLAVIFLLLMGLALLNLV